MQFPPNPAMNQKFWYQQKQWKYNGIGWMKQTPDYTVVDMNTTYGISPGDDVTDILEQTVNSGKPVSFIDGTYLINRPIVCTKSAMITGNKETSGVIFMPATNTQTGYLFDIRSSCSFSGVSGKGYNVDGSYFVGSDFTCSVSSNIEYSNITNFDICINFTNNTQHPLGLKYSNIYMQVFNTASIIVGGTGVNQSNGEDCWIFEQVMTSNGWKPDVVFSSTKTTNAADTIDTVTWTPPSIVPTYGYQVLRSSNGSTGWHSPPNWNTIFFTGTTFPAEKKVGEVWAYKVIRATFGAILSRGKNITIINGHIGEQTTFALVFNKCPNVSITNAYTESRNGTNMGGTLPSGATAAIVGISSDISIDTAWCEGYSWYAWAIGGSGITASNIRYSAAIPKYAMFAMDSDVYNHVNYNGRAPDNIPKIAPLSGSSIAIAADYFSNTTNYIDGRNVTISSPKSAMFNLAYAGNNYFNVVSDSSGSSIQGNHLTLTNKQKDKQTVLLNNPSIATFLTNDVSTPVCQFDITSGNGAGSVEFGVTITSGFVGAVRQVAYATVSVLVLNSAGTISSNATILNQSSLLVNATFAITSVTAAVSGTTITLSIRATSTGASPGLTCYIVGNSSAGFTMANYKVL